MLGGGGGSGIHWDYQGLVTPQGARELERHSWGGGRGKVWGWEGREGGEGWTEQSVKVGKERKGKWGGG